jgi:hypothetical protein
MINFHLKKNVMTKVTHKACNQNLRKIMETKVEERWWKIYDEKKGILNQINEAININPNYAYQINVKCMTTILLF